jgi:hypothetical protein
MARRRAGELDPVGNPMRKGVICMISIMKVVRFGYCGRIQDAFSEVGNHKGDRDHVPSIIDRNIEPR